MTVAAEERLSLGLKMGHGLGSVAMGVKEAGLTTFFMLYYNQVLGYDPRLISYVLIIAMLADALIDPMIGRLSDATRTKWGRRLPWIYGAAVPMAISWAMLWTYREPDSQSILLLIVNVIAVRLFVSACEIPAASLTAELTRDYDERTVLTRFRFLFGWSGGLIATALAYGYFLASDDPTKNGLLNGEGYESFGYFGAILLLLSTFTSALVQHKKVVAMPVRPARPSQSGMIADLYRAFRNPSFKALAWAGLFIVASYGTTIAAINYMMLYVWQLTDQQITLYPAGLAIAVIAAFLLVSPLHRRFGKKNSASIGAVASAAIAFLTYGARNFGLWPELGGDISAALLLLLLTASLFCQIITTISASSMIAEVVEDHEANHDERCEGMFYAGYFMVQKFGQAFGIFLVGQMIALAGLGGQVTPSGLAPDIADKMGWAFVTIVMILAIATSLALRHYRIDRASHEARIAAIAAKSSSDIKSSYASENAAN